MTWRPPPSRSQVTLGQSSSWSTRAFCPKSPGLVRNGGWLSGAELAACWCLVVHWCWPHGRATERARGSRRAPSPGGHVPLIVRREPPIPGRQKIMRTGSGAGAGAGGKRIPKLCCCCHRLHRAHRRLFSLISGGHICCVTVVDCGGRALCKISPSILLTSFMINTRTHSNVWREEAARCSASCVDRSLGAVRPVAAGRSVTKLTNVSPGRPVRAGARSGVLGSAGYLERPQST